ncbi:hypothetical protein TNCV_2033811, partial [Trichonephila clavipes]
WPPVSPGESQGGKKEGENWNGKKRAENREGSLGFPGSVKPVFTKDSKPLGRRERKITRAPRERETRTHPKEATRGLLVMDLVILKHGQMTRATPELAAPSPNYHTNERTFQLSIDLAMHLAALHGGSFVALGSNSRHANHDSIP